MLSIIRKTLYAAKALNVSSFRFLSESAVSASQNVMEAPKSSRKVVKTPQRKASKLLNELKWEAFDKLKNGRQWPEFSSGDSIQLEMLPYMSAKQGNVIKGVVIGIANRASDTSIKLMNVEYGTPIMRHFALYDPLIKDLKVLQKAFIHKGLKRVRRSKLYYLTKRHPDAYTVK